MALIPILRDGLPISIPAVDNPVFSVPAPPVPGVPALISMTEGTVAPASVSDRLQLFGLMRSGHHVPATIDDANKVERLGPWWANKTTFEIMTAVNSTALSPHGLVLQTHVGATPLARTITNTNAMTQQRRVGLMTAATAPSLMEVKGNAGIVSRAAPAGGFRSVYRWGISALALGARGFVGLTVGTAAWANADPGTQLDLIGLYKNAQASGTPTWTFGTAGAAAGSVSSLDLAISAPHVATIATGDIFQLEVAARPDVDGFAWRVTKWASATGAESSHDGFSSGALVPAQTAILTPRIWCSNNTVAAAQGFDLMFFKCEPLLSAG